MFKIKKIIVYFEKKFKMCFKKLFIYLKIIEYNFKLIIRLKILDFIDDNNFNISLKHSFINNLSKFINTFFNIIFNDFTKSLFDICRLSFLSYIEN